MTDRFLYGLYTALLLLVICVTWPYWLARYFFTPKYRGTVRQRLTLFDPAVQCVLSGHGGLWVHAVSVGEVMAALPLLHALHERYPEWPVVLSTVTRTGNQIARERVPYATTVFYLPLDLPWLVRRLVHLVRPHCVLVMETEFWPNLFRVLASNRIPLIVANGRVSPRSAPRYHRFRFAMRRFLRPVSLFLMQSDADATRLRGFCSPDAVIEVTGNLKYDQALVLPDPDAQEILRTRFGPDRPIWVAASTHPGEEEQLLACYQRLQHTLPSLRWILVPRHPERADMVSQLLETVGCPCQRLSTLQDGPWQTPVLLVDAVGWLQRLYGLATVVFVGGSLVPHGGQNPLEPAAWGIAPLFGPHMRNFTDITGQLLAADAAIQVTDATALHAHLQELLAHPATRQAMGERARAVVLRNVGATQRCLTPIHDLLVRCGNHPA